MTDNERIQEIEHRLNFIVDDLNLHYDEDVYFLLQQLEQRGKTIAILDETVRCYIEGFNRVEQQNQLMWSALKQAKELLDEWMSIPYRRSFILTHDIALELSTAIDEAVAKVEAITVSEQGVTSDSVVPSEPTL